MAKSSLLPGFIRLPGKAGRVLNTLTGLELSDRQYKKLKRETSEKTPRINGKKIISNEALAKYNKSLNLGEFLSKPARGRTSIKKFAPTIRAYEIEKRKQALEEKEALQNATKEERKIFNKIERLKNKKIGKKIFRRNLLRHGKLSRTIAVDNLDNALTILKSAKESDVVFGYMIGISGVSDKDGRKLEATLMRLQSINDELSVDETNKAAGGFLENHPYFVFLNWWVHLRFKEDFAKTR